MRDISINIKSVTNLIEHIVWEESVLFLKKYSELLKAVSLSFLNYDCYEDTGEVELVKVCLINKNGEEFEVFSPQRVTTLDFYSTWGVGAEINAELNVANSQRQKYPELYEDFCALISKFETIGLPFIYAAYSYAKVIHILSNGRVEQIE